MTDQRTPAIPPEEPAVADLPDSPSAAFRLGWRKGWMAARMDVGPDYERGFNAGVRYAIRWLHERARAMNDPHAVCLLNSAATNLGWDERERLGVEEEDE